MKRRPVMLAIDPGKVCGVAYYVRGVFRSHEFPHIDTIPWVRGIILGQPDHSELNIVCERFTTGGGASKKTRQSSALEVIGAVGAMVDELNTPHKIITFGLQPVAEAKKLGTTETLKRIDWWNATRDGHANDAARHILFGLLRMYPEELERVLQGHTISENAIAD